MLAWSAYEKELFTLVTTIQKWRPYLIGHIFIVRIDHQSLKFLLEQKVGTSIQQKRVSKLLGYDFRVEYKKVIEHRVADALSRRDESGKEEVEVSIYALLAPTTDCWEEIKKRYHQDPYTSKLPTQFKNDQLP